MAAMKSGSSAGPNGCSAGCSAGHSGSTARRSTLSARVLKVMGLFSGVHIISILCSLVRTKLVAIWLGPAGIGLYGIFNSALETATAIAQTGTGPGVVRMLSGAPKERLATLVAVVRRWGYALALGGAFLTMVMSPWLSRLTFGDGNHVWGFVVLSIAVLFSVLSQNEASIFQGLQRYRKLALASVAGAVASLAVVIPMYRIWGIDSVVPSILVMTFASWLFRGLYHERVPGQVERMGVRETIKAGKGFAILGVYVTVTSFASNAVSYIFMSYLNREAGVEMAGFYQGGFTLVNRYVGLVLTALAMEYFPRLSAVGVSTKRTRTFLSHEMLLILIVMFPVVTVFIAADTPLVMLLYDREFLVMLPFITWAIIGTIFRAVSFCMAYIILARDDGPAYLVTELLSAVAAIILNILCFNRWGITGLGYAYALWYLFYTLEVAAVTKWRYGVLPGARQVWLAAGITLYCLATLAVRQYAGWEAAAVMAAISVAVSLVALSRLLRRERKF